MKITFARLGALALTAALASLAVVLGTAAAIDEVNDKPAPLGLVGMTQEQALRLSIAYISGFDPQPDPPRCLVKVGFARADGVAIGDPRIFELRPGTAHSFDLAASAIGDPGHPRLCPPDRHGAGPEGRVPGSRYRRAARPRGDSTGSSSTTRSHSPTPGWRGVSRRMNARPARHPVRPDRRRHRTDRPRSLVAGSALAQRGSTQVLSSRAGGRGEPPFPADGR